MARLTQQQIQQAIKRQRPGFEVVEKPVDVDTARVRGAAPDAVSPDLEKARKTYRSEAQRRARGNPAGDDDAASQRDDTMVVIKPKDVDTDRVGAGAKQVLLDAKGNIVAEQG